MKRYLYLIVYIGLGLSLAACKQQPKKFVIGVSQCSEDIWRDKLNDELKMGEYLNDSIIVKLASSNDDNVLQNRQVNQFVDEGVDLLVISPNQLSAISKAVERAYEKGIPVILYDRFSNTDKYTALIAELIEEVLNSPEDEKVIARVREKVNETMKDYPLFAY